MRPPISTAIADYGLLANLLTVPVMGAIIMPMGAVAALLAPLGLAGLPLWVMEQGARWILFVAHWIAGLDGSVTAIAGAWAMGLAAAHLRGDLGDPVARSSAGFGAAANPCGLSAVDQCRTTRPSDLGRWQAGLGLIRTRGQGTVSASRGGGFAAETWLENDGDLAGQRLAAERAGFTGLKGERWFDLAGLTAVSLSGKEAAGKLDAACAKAGTA